MIGAAKLSAAKTEQHKEEVPAENKSENQHQLIADPNLTQINKDEKPENEGLKKSEKEAEDAEGEEDKEQAIPQGIGEKRKAEGKLPAGEADKKQKQW